MIAGLNYAQGKRHAQKQQAQGMKPTTIVPFVVEGREASSVPLADVLLVAVQLRDGLRQTENRSEIEDAMMEHLDGWLSQWD